MNRPNYATAKCPGCGWEWIRHFDQCAYRPALVPPSDFVTIDESHQELSEEELSEFAEKLHTLKTERLNLERHWLDLGAG